MNAGFHRRSAFASTKKIPTACSVVDLDATMRLPARVREWIDCDRQGGSSEGAGCRSGLADSAGEAGDEQGSEGPSEELESPAGDGQDLTGGGVGEIAALPCPGFDQWQAEVQADTDPFDRRALATGGCGVRTGDTTMRPEDDGESGRHGDDGKQSHQRSPRLVPVAKDQTS
jgi:hypothetical protein